MQRVEIAGQQFEYEVHGDGSPVVAVRNVAAPTGAWPTPGETTALNDAGLALVSYRHLGTTDTIEGIATDVGRLIDHLDIGPVALWGWSQGAMTAQELALARPDVVSGAVMMATRARLTAYDRFRYTVEPYMDDSDVGVMLGIVMQHANDAICDDAFFDRVLGGYRSMTADTSDEAETLRGRANRAGTVYGEPSRCGALAGISVPCMVIAFSHDVNIPPALNREVADAIPGCEYVEIEGAGHSGGITHRREIRDHLLPFLRC